MPCKQIHTLFMRFPIDVVFLDAKQRVLRVCPHISPWHFSPFLLSAKSVLESASEALASRVKVGDHLAFSLNPGAEHAA